MKKTDFILKIQSLKDLDFNNELMADGYTLSISAWEPNGEFMIDQHVTEFFPELEEEYGMEEVEEGQMISTAKSIEVLAMMLTASGYTVQY